MKCIQCGVDNNLKDRQGNNFRCKQCHHPFAFEPTTMGVPKITDPFFAKVIADLSASSTLHFTPKQLLYLLDRRLKRKPTMNFSATIFLYLIPLMISMATIGGLLSFLVDDLAYALTWLLYNFFWIWGSFQGSNSQTSSRAARRASANRLLFLGATTAVLGTIIGFNTQSFPIYGLAALQAISAVWLGYGQRRRTETLPEKFTITATQMQAWLDRWTAINGSVEKLLLPPAETLLPASPFPNADVSAYSFDRLVVCQSDAIAQLLINNHFHFEHNCAILSITGYPHPIFDTTMQMLHRNPNLTVFAFHDCDPEGVALTHHLRTNPRWFPDGQIAIVDVGLLPRQVLAAKQNLFVQNSTTVAPGARELPQEVWQGLSREELQWLDAGNFVELESFTPQQLLRILHRSMATGQATDTTDGGLILMGDSGSTIYAMDSFG